MTVGANVVARVNFSVTGGAQLLLRLLLLFFGWITGHCRELIQIVGNRALFRFWGTKDAQDGRLGQVTGMRRRNRNDCLANRTSSCLSGMIVMSNQAMPLRAVNCNRHGLSPWVSF
ncbi:MAG: hypothetical protein FWD31_10440 [Planctomycetaceae bacterium]|nr:hypothetical protein [Planctomycetaceae bacterium]